MVLKHEANDAYKNLPPNEKYGGHVGGVVLGDTATHLLKNYSATVGPVKGKSTVIAAEYVVVRTILELCGAGLIDLDSDLGIDHSLGVDRKSLCFFFLCFCASDYTWSHAKRRISSMRIDTAIEVKWKSSSSGGVVEAHTCPCATHIGQVSCYDAAQLVTIKVGAAGITTTPSALSVPLVPGGFRVTGRRVKVGPPRVPVLQPRRPWQRRCRC